MSFFGIIASSFLKGTPSIPALSPIRVLVIGDSIANGTNEIYANADTDDSIQGISGADTLYEWDGASLLDRVGGDTIGANNGSQYPSMANKLKELTGRKVHIVETANGGAEFVYDHDTNHWGTGGGVLYGQMLTKANSYLSNQSANFDIIKITLGINDARGDTLLADIQTGTTSLIDRLNTDFPNTKIVINQLGKSSATASRVTAIRGYIDDLVDNYTNVYAGKDLNLYPIEYYFDGLHLRQQYNNLLGEDDAVIISGIL